mmetsp:Transcript_33302/g.80545  ORF Transcript_33302/g.80545 Transcript_33302/m.80545 type:complete len:192 (+) Transcript_33302:852-1427(+)
MPEGGQPSAQVIRPSQSSNVAATITQQPQRIATSQISHRDSKITPAQGALMVLLPCYIYRDVVEHSVSPMERKTTRFQRKQSRFAQQAKGSHNLNSNGLSQNAGFPSVHIMPIGTFVKKPASIRNGNKPKSTRQLPSTPIPQVVEQSKSEQESMQQERVREMPPICFLKCPWKNNPIASTRFGSRTFTQYQ